MGMKLGIEAKMYFSLTPINAPNWSELDLVHDAALNLEKGEEDATTRRAGGWEAVIGVLRKASIEIDIPWDTDDAGFQALLDVFTGVTSGIAIAVMDGEIAVPGSQGLWADCDVLSFNRSEPAAGKMNAAITIKPTYSANPPEWKKI